MPETQQAQQQPLTEAPADTEQVLVPEQQLQAQAPVETEQVQESEQEMEEQPAEEDVSRTEFMNLAEALESGKDALNRLPQSNPQRLKAFLVNDLYPILIDLANIANWYTGDLHGRVTTLEEEASGTGGLGIDEEFAAELIQFIGQALHVFGLIIPALQSRPDLANVVQLLVARAPGLISRIQDLTVSDEDEDEDEDDEDEFEDEGDVLDPSTGEPVDESAEPADATPSGDVTEQSVADVTEPEVSSGQIQEEASAVTASAEEVSSGQSTEQNVEQPEVEAPAGDITPSEVSDGGNS